MMDAAEFDREKLHNPLLARLLVPEFADTLAAVVDRKATLLLPHSASLSEELYIGKSFVAAHIALRHELRPELLLVVCGLLAAFDSSSPRQLHVLSPKSKLRGLPSAREAWDSQRALLDSWDSSRRSGVSRSSLRVLREGEVLLGKVLVPLVLLSAPVTYEGCAWSPERLDAVQLGPMPTQRESSLLNFSWLFGKVAVPAAPAASAPSSRASVSSLSSNSLAQSGRDVLYEKLKDPKASDVTRMLAGFLEGFQQRPPKPDEMGNVLHSFITLVLTRLRSHVLWQSASEAEFDAALDSLEKYLVVKLYALCFQELSEDARLSQRIAQLRAWLRFEHLDISKHHRHEARLGRAIAELRKMNEYKPPKEKLVCVLNCCKAVYSILNEASKANPPRLYSNVTYLQRFRAPSRLIAESGYYLTHLMSTIIFVEQLDASQLKIDPAEFERNMALAAGSPLPASNPVPSITLLEDSSLSVSLSLSSPSTSLLDAPAPLSLLRVGLTGSDASGAASSTSRSASASASASRSTDKGDALEALSHGHVSSLGNGNASSADPLLKYYHTPLEELRVADVAPLLALYKRLCHTHSRLGEELRLGQLRSPAQPGHGQGQGQGQGQVQGQEAQGQGQVPGQPQQLRIQANAIANANAPVIPTAALSSTPDSLI